VLVRQQIVPVVRVHIGFMVIRVLTCVR